jgi:hypothetical protein
MEAFFKLNHSPDLLHQRRRRGEQRLDPPDHKR